MGRGYPCPADLACAGCDPVGLVILAIGEDPIAAVKLMVTGALGSTYGWGYTLYYATNFMFTGLAVAIAFHARLFNIGGEGQAAWAAWAWHWPVSTSPGRIGPCADRCDACGALFGAAWAAIPAYLQAKRGSHIVITTIMFNFIAAALLNYVLVNVLRPKGSMDPATARFPEARTCQRCTTCLPLSASRFQSRRPQTSPSCSSCSLRLLWVLIWRTRLGYEIRAFGHSESAAKYAGIALSKSS